MPADPSDLAAVAAVKSARRDSSTTFDALIQEMLTDASSQMAAYTGRRIAPLDTAAADRFFDVADAYDPIRRELWVWDLSEAPTEVELLDAAGDSIEIITVSSGLVLTPRNREAWQPIERLRFRAATTTPRGGGEIRVKGKWGWPAVPGFVRRACVDAVVEWMKDAQSLTAPSPDQFEPGSPPARALPLKTRTALNSIRRFGIA